MTTVKIENLANEIMKAMSEYTEEVSKAIETEKEDTAKAIVKELKQSTSWADRTGKYRKGFTVKKVGSKGNQAYYVYNKNKPQVTHLLEKGHLLRNGTRTKARAHFRPVADKHIAQLERRIEQIVKNGGR